MEQPAGCRQVGFSSPRTHQFSKSCSPCALLLPCSLSLHPRCLHALQGPVFEAPSGPWVPAPAWRQQLPGGRAGREVAAGARGVGGEAGIRSWQRAGTCCLSELIPRATPESRPSCLARFSPFLPHPCAWDYTVLGWLCSWVWDLKLVEPTPSR